MIIREETSADYRSIFDLTAAAFEPMPFSNGSEPDIINQLRRDKDLVLSLVAEDAGDVVGQVTFSPVRISQAEGSWIGLGPVAVTPSRQKQKIGGALINAGLSRIKALGANGCVLIGNPNYYRRFGFQSADELTYANLPTEYVQYLAFDGPTPKGEIIYSPAFEQS
jgi:putative acetyltransferase